MNYTHVKYVGRWIPSPSECFCLSSTHIQRVEVSAHLRGDVVRGPTEGLGGNSVFHVLLTHAKVSDFDVTLCVQHDIIQL